MKLGGLAERVFPLHDIDRPAPTGIGDQDGCPPRERLRRPCEEVLGTAANPDADLPRAIRAPGRDGKDTDHADAGFVTRQRTPPSHEESWYY
jgi:hypothetical protein